MWRAAIKNSGRLLPSPTRQLGSAGIYPGRVGVGFGLGPAVPGEKSKEQATSRQRTLSAKVNAEDNNEPHGKKDHFPAPWTVEKIAGGFKVIDANGQSLAYVYSSENPHDAFMRKVLTLDEARRIASNIAKLPDLLGKVSPP